VDTRKYAILDTLYYTIDDNGMPVKSTIIERLNEGVPAKPKPTFTRQAINPEYVITSGRNGRMNLRKLFGDAMHGNQIWHDDELKKRVMSLASIVSDGLYYKQLNQAVMDKVVAKSYDGCGKVIYHLLPESLTLDLGYDYTP